VNRRNFFKALAATATIAAGMALPTLAFEQKQVKIITKMTYDVQYSQSYLANLHMWRIHVQIDGQPHILEYARLMEVDAEQNTQIMKFVEDDRDASFAKVLETDFVPTLGHVTV
jgi:hypothetical protein